MTKEKFTEEIDSILKCQIEENEKITHVFSFYDDTDALNFVAALMRLGLKPFIEPTFEATSSVRKEMFICYKIGVKYDHLVPTSFYERKITNKKRNHE